MTMNSTELDKRTENRIKTKVRSYTDVWLRDKIFQRYGNKCVICDNNFNLEIHHKVYGWKPLLKDCTILCRNCHNELNNGKFPIIIRDTFLGLDDSTYKLASTDIKILELIQIYPEGTYDIARKLTKDTAHIHRRLKHMKEIGLLDIMEGYPVRYKLKSSIKLSKLVTYVECNKCKQIHKIPRNSYIFLCKMCGKKQKVFEKNVKSLI